MEEEIDREHKNNSFLAFKIKTAAIWAKEPRLHVIESAEPRLCGHQNIIIPSSSKKMVVPVVIVPYHYYVGISLQVNRTI